MSFDWSDVSGATFYKVFASVNGAAASVLAVTRDSHYEGSLPAGASVDWWVETGADNCTPIASAHAHFNVTSAGICPSNPQSATLLTPANGATGLTSPVRFEWDGRAGCDELRGVGRDREHHQQQRAIRPRQDRRNACHRPRAAGQSGLVRRSRFRRLSDVDVFEGLHAHRRHAGGLQRQPGYAASRRSTARPA